MKPAVAAFAAGAAVAVAVALGAAAASPGPSGTLPAAATFEVPAPRDRAFPGEITLTVDATDVLRRIIHVRETLSGAAGDTVLLYPQWLPGTHAPEGTLERLAGLTISVGGVPLAWTRDPANVWAFRVHLPHRAASVQIDFDYLSPTSSSQGDLEIDPDLLMIEWNELLLYPAGYFSRRIPVQATLTLPPGWQLATALPVAVRDGTHTDFQQVSLNTFIDSPVFAGRYVRQLDLAPGAAVAVHLNLFADRESDLAIGPEQAQAYRALVQQAYRLFDSHHYAHYDFLYALSDSVQHLGLEHHQSSEDGSVPDVFTHWTRTAYAHYLLAHEYVHSWNGKFRRPADLWTPNYNVPMQDSLLWVYEGLTQYWGYVLAARSGLWTHQQALDEFAQLAAYAQVEPGRRWRSLQDTTNDEIINPRRPQPWRDWSRFEDYYDEGALIWLEADTLIRERSAGERSLDDFARSFFGIDDGSFVTRTYTFADIVKALNAVQPYDWAAFLRQRLDTVAAPAPLEGLHLGGFRLAFSDVQSQIARDADAERHRVSLFYSIGLVLNDHDKPGSIAAVRWGSPAFEAALTNGGQILAVDGHAYSSQRLEDALRAAVGSTGPIDLTVKVGDAVRVAHVYYHGGLRYPHLQRDATEPPRLDAILAAR